MSCSPGQNKAWPSERLPTARTRHSTEHHRDNTYLSLYAVIKITHTSQRDTEKTELRHVPQFQAASCSLGGRNGGGGGGHSSPRTGGSHGRCHRLQNANQKLQQSPILFLLLTLSLSGGSPIPHKEPMVGGEGTQPELSCQFPPEMVPTLSQTHRIDVKRKTVNLYRTACQAVLFLKDTRQWNLAR